MLWTPLGKTNSRFEAYIIHHHQVENGLVQPTLLGPRETACLYL